MTIIAWTLFALGITVGLALNLVGLFGNWVILGTIAAAWAISGFERFGFGALLIMAVLAALGELLEMLAAGYGASRFGGGRGAAFASLLGCIAGAVVGTPWFPLVGTLAGAVLGAFAGAALFELLIVNKTPHDSLRTGFGAALGRIGGVFAKTAIGIAILIVALFSL